SKVFEGTNYARKTSRIEKYSKLSVIRKALRASSSSDIRMNYAKLTTANNSALRTSSSGDI
ncbi:921_t:CDS:2, partial [Diversispora eburnea]